MEWQNVMEIAKQIKTEETRLKEMADYEIICFKVKHKNNVTSLMR